MSYLSPILVTGAAGFIGFHVSKTLLEQGYHVVGIDNVNDYYATSLKEDRLKILSNFEGFTFIKQDIADHYAMNRIWIDHGPFLHVVHLAAQAGVRHSLENPFAYAQSNILGHLSILECCRHTDNFQHLVYASSSSVYGSNSKLPYAVSDRTDHPVSLYAATKRSDELMSHSYSHLYNLPQTGLRFFTVYGPWGRPDMSPFIFANAINKGQKVPVFNHGQMKRDFTYIDDIVSGILATLNTIPDAGKTTPHRVLNIGNNKSENLLDFIDTIARSLGKNADLELLPMQDGDVKETYADITETTALTGYRPTTSIENGIPQFIAWYKSYYIDS